MSGLTRQLSPLPLRKMFPSDHKLVIFYLKDDCYSNPDSRRNHVFEVVYSLMAELRKKGVRVELVNYYSLGRNELYTRYSTIPQEEIEFGLYKLPPVEEIGRKSKLLYQGVVKDDWIKDPGMFNEFFNEILRRTQTNLLHYAFYRMTSAFR